MIDLKPSMGVILKLLKPASENSLAHSFSFLSWPVTKIIMSISKNICVSIDSSSPFWFSIIMSMIITFPPSLSLIASLHFLSILTHSSSFQSCRIHCSHPSQRKYKTYTYSLNNILPDLYIYTHTRLMINDIVYGK